MTTTPMNNAVGPQVRQKRRPRRKLVPVMAGASMIVGLQAATQQFAHTFDYHSTLGLHVGHFYLPWHVLGWASRWHAVYPQELMHAGSVGILAAGAGLLATAMVARLQANAPVANQYMHGSARWAVRADIEDAGLLPREKPRLQDLLRLRKQHRALSESVYVGGWIDPKGQFHYLRHSGPEHVLTYAPTRAGKGVALIIPTLLSWARSLFVSDLRGELWAATAGWRKRYARNKVLKFEPAALEGSARWNALDEVRVGTEYEVGDVQNIAQMIVDPDGRGIETHWQKTSYALITGLILHALYKARNGHGPRASLPVVDHLLADPQRATADLWVEMTTYEHTRKGNHPVVSAAARDQIDRHEEEAGSVLSSLKSYLSLYRDPIVARNVSHSDFRIRDLMHHQDPVSLYFVTQPVDKERLRPLVRLLTAMVIRVLAGGYVIDQGRVRAAYKHRLLAMLDEFPALGKLSILQGALAWLAFYGIKCYLIAQDINQLKSRDEGYGPDETITSNCHIQNAFAPNRIETAEYLSRCTGQTTVLKNEITVSGNRVGAVQGQVSRTIREHARNLLTPDEAMRMPGARKDAEGNIVEAGDMVIYVAGRPAIYGKQPLYFQDPVFMARASVPPPAISDRIVAAHEAPAQAPA
jgi:type IV secretion system protein VirD4